MHCDMFRAGMGVSDVERHAAIMHDLQVVHQQLLSMGVTEEFADEYQERCGGVCVKHNSLVCNKHETMPPPLPKGMMDERVFYSQLKRFDEQIDRQNSVVEECRVRWANLAKERRRNATANVFLSDVSHELQVTGFIVV